MAAVKILNQINGYPNTVPRRPNVSGEHCAACPRGPAFITVSGDRIICLRDFIQSLKGKYFGESQL
jgi:hypothetical protein